MSSNGDTKRTFTVNDQTLKGIGSFHKTLPHNEYGEVDQAAFDALVAATDGDGHGFAAVPKGTRPEVTATAKFTNPQGGLAADRLTAHPASFTMPPAPSVLSETTAAEFTELLWMAELRDTPFDTFTIAPKVATAAAEIRKSFALAVADSADLGHLKTGVDVPGAAGALSNITPKNIFRLGLPGEEIGPMVSQFFLRDIHYGTQKIDQMQRPYATGCNYLTKFEDWLRAQNSGVDVNGQDYGKANEFSEKFFDPKGSERLISTPRDLARFVNKDALHQAYFNATLLLLSGEAKWRARLRPNVRMVCQPG